MHLAVTHSCLCLQSLQTRGKAAETWARKLALRKCWDGHSGCVNRLAWNDEGTFLASGSDDKQVQVVGTQAAITGSDLYVCCLEGCQPAASAVLQQALSATTRITFCFQQP